MQAYRNDLPMEARLRELGRGRLLDRHHGETGLAQTLSPGDEKDLLQLSATNRTDPCVVTVGLSVLEVEAAVEGMAVNARLQAMLSWATGRGEARAVIDARNGGQITLAANVLNVSVRYTGTAGAKFKVSAFAAYGNRPGACHPALTFTDDLVSPGATGAIVVPGRQIPAFASSVAWMSPDDPLGFVPPAATLRFVTDRGAGAAVIEQAAPPANTFVPIPNGSYFIQIRNDGDEGANYALIYELVL